MEAEGVRKKVVNQLSPRIREDEESWISGEELQTEGSSDEEKPRKHHHHQTKKMMKSHQRAGEIKERHENDLRNFIKSEEEKSNILSEFKSNREDRKDIQQKQSEEIGRARSQSLTESLNLEHKWRPKRGSLKLPSLSDGSSVEV